MSNPVKKTFFTLMLIASCTCVVLTACSAPRYGPRVRTSLWVDYNENDRIDPFEFKTRNMGPYYSNEYVAFHVDWRAIRCARPHGGGTTAVFCTLVAPNGRSFELAETQLDPRRTWGDYCLFRVSDLVKDGGPGAWKAIWRGDDKLIGIGAAMLSDRISLDRHQ